MHYWCVNQYVFKFFVLRSFAFYINIYLIRISIQNNLDIHFYLILIEFKLPLITHSYAVSMLLPFRKATRITKKRK
jgi:hypothetical protein